MVVTRRFRLKTQGNCDVHDITDLVAREVQASKLKDGIATVFTPSATSAITTLEFEPGLLNDMADYWDRSVPIDIRYSHDFRWHDGNGHAHIRAALQGPSLTIPFVDNKLILGTWQQLIFLDFDNRPRDREVVVQIIGE
jgi:secondary thiamine-phosphate synthase enzyme